MLDLINTLAQIDIFEDLTTGQLSEVATICHTMTAGKGEILAEYGSPGSHMYALIEGCVEVQFASYDESESYRTICQLRKGHIIGEMSLLDGEGRSARIRLTENSKLIAFSKADLFALNEKDYHIGYIIMYNLAKVLSKRLRYTNLAIRHGMFD
jgi:CRP-like cAMP-binding protein